MIATVDYTSQIHVLFYMYIKHIAVHQVFLWHDRYIFTVFTVLDEPRRLLLSSQSCLHVYRWRIGADTT